MKTAPRQQRAIKSAATKLIPVLVDSGVGIVRDQLDQLMPQFKASNPAFCNAYFSARVVGNPKSKRTSTAGGTAVVTPETKKAA